MKYYVKLSSPCGIFGKPGTTTGSRGELGLLRRFTMPRLLISTPTG
jgi:hypothetical protein